ncbi:sugar ABC transporter substrate-binding protein [Salinibacterium sp.]|uniref:ABC transporter substrate-binding protein n=1 Tax=Salinibacterium sp. TaxID=1915057 RepID=UPI00286D3E5B|nr:sugar ABC transporter substrate-binding protein [Salinibacterium sp.]
MKSQERGVAVLHSAQLSRRTLLRGGVGLGAAGALSALLAACAAPASPAGSLTTLKFAYLDVLKNDYKDLFAASKKSGGLGIAVENVPGGWPELVTRINALRQTGKAPDLSAMSVSLIPGMIANGQLEDIAPFAKNLDRTKFSEASINTYVDGDHLWALPSSQYTQVMYYNKTLLDAAGIGEPPASWDSPWSFEEWRAAAEAATSGDGEVYGAAIELHPERTSQYLWSNDATFLSDDLTSYEMDSPEAIDTFEFLAKMFKDGLVPPESLLTTVPLMDMFTSGRLATMVNGAWAMAGASAISDFEWGVTPAPSGSTGKSYTPVWVDGWLMPEGGKNGEAAFTALEYFESPEAWNLLLAANVGGIPPLLSVLEENKATMFPGLSGERKGVWFDSIDHTRKYGFPVNYAQISNAVAQQLSLVSTGDVSAAEALKGLKDPVEALLRQA